MVVREIQLETGQLTPVTQNCGRESTASAADVQRAPVGCVRRRGDEGREPTASHRGASSAWDASLCGCDGGGHQPPVQTSSHEDGRDPEQRTWALAGRAMPTTTPPSGPDHRTLGAPPTTLRTTRTHDERVRRLTCCAQESQLLARCLEEVQDRRRPSGAHAGPLCGGRARWPRRICHECAAPPLSLRARQPVRGQYVTHRTAICNVIHKSVGFNQFSGPKRP